MIRMMGVLAPLAAMTLGLAGPAHGDSFLFTSPLDRTGRAFQCLAANVGTTPITVLFEAVDTDGNADLSTPQGIVIAPGHATGFGLLSGNGSSILYCRFTVLVGNKGKVRAHACVALSTTLPSACAVSDHAR